MKKINKLKEEDFNNIMLGLKIVDNLKKSRYLEYNLSQYLEYKLNQFFKITPLLIIIILVILVVILIYNIL